LICFCVFMSLSMNDTNGFVQSCFTGKGQG